MNLRTVEYDISTPCTGTEASGGDTVAAFHLALIEEDMIRCFDEFECTPLGRISYHEELGNFRQGCLS